MATPALATMTSTHQRGYSPIRELLTCATVQEPLRPQLASVASISRLTCSRPTSSAPIALQTGAAAQMQHFFAGLYIEVVEQSGSKLRLAVVDATRFVSDEHIMIHVTQSASAVDQYCPCSLGLIRQDRVRRRLPWHHCKSPVTARTSPCRKFFPRHKWRAS